MTEPKIWSKFETKLKDGTAKQFTIQNVPISMTEKVIDLLKEDFVYETPISSAAIAQSEDNLDIILGFYSKFVIPQGHAIMCVEDSEEPLENKEIVGVNLLVHVKNDDPKPPFTAIDNPLIKTMLIIGEQVDVFEKYNVTEYLGAWGLCINRKYRGLKIGQKIVSVREQICKDMGLKVTETLFTGLGGQKIALNLNYEVLFEMKFSELEKLSNLRFDPKHDKYMIMAKVFD